MINNVFTCLQYVLGQLKLTNQYLHRQRVVYLQLSVIGLLEISTTIQTFISYWKQLTDKHQLGWFLFMLIRDGPFSNNR